MITNARTLEADAAHTKDLSLNYERQGEALEEGRTKDVCHNVALYLRIASEALSEESAQLRKYFIEEEGEKAAAVPGPALVDIDGGPFRRT